MTTTLDSIRRRLEERLAGLEGRLKGTAIRLQDEPADPSEKSMVSRMQVQKREIDDLKEQLEESRRKRDALDEELRRQRENIARLVTTWEKRLQDVQQESQHTADDRMAREQELAFLKADLTAQMQRIETLTAENQEQGLTARRKDQEIARLFTRIEALEEENRQLVQKMGSYQLRVRTYRVRRDEPLEQPRAGKRLFGWLSRPLIVVRTGDDVKN